MRRLGYGVGAVAYAAPYTMIAGGYLLYATVILGVPPALAGAMLAASLIWDAVSDPIVGQISDNTFSRVYGRRHLFIAVGGGATALLTLAFWSIPQRWGTTATAAAVMTLLLLIRTALTVFYIPFNALGAELSKDRAERISLQSYRGALYVVGMLLATAGVNIFFFRSTPAFPQGQLNPAAYPAIGTALAAVILVAALITTAATRPRGAFLAAPARQPTDRMLQGLARNFMICLRNKNFMFLTAAIFLVELGFQASIVLGFHVNTFVYALTGPQLALIGLSILGLSVLSQPFWAWFAGRWGKRDALILAMAFGLVGFVGSPWVHVWWRWFPIADGAGLPTLCAFGAIGGIANGAFMSLPYALVADAVDADAGENSNVGAGVYFGVFNFAYKAGVSISIIIGGLILAHFSGAGSLADLPPSELASLALAPSWLLLLLGPPIVVLMLRISTRQESGAPDFSPPEHGHERSNCQLLGRA